MDSIVRQPDQFSDVRRLIKSYEPVLTGKDTRSRHDKYDRTLAYQKGAHWQSAQYIGPATVAPDKPAIQLTLWATEQWFAKLWHGQAFRPEVVIEKTLNGVDLGQLAGTLKLVPGKSVDERMARLLTAVLDYIWERLDAHTRIRAAAKAATWYGDGFVLDGLDSAGDLFVDPVHPSRVWIDPCATEFKDARFFGYSTRRSLQYIRQAFPEFGGQVKAGKTEEPMRLEARNEQDFALPSDDDHAEVDLECWYLKDLSRQTVQDTHQTQNQQELMQMQQQGWTVVQETADQILVPNSPVSGTVMEVPVAWTLTRQRDAEVYPGGWRRVYRAGGIILSDGTGPQTAEPCLHHIRCIDVPGEFWSVSIVDMARELNSGVDELAAYARTIADEGPTVITVPGSLSFNSAANKVQRGLKHYTFKADATAMGVTSPIQMVPGAEMSATHANLMRQYQDWLQLLTGAFDLRAANNLPQDASGKFVEAVQGATEGRVSLMREEIRRVVRSVAKNLLGYVLAQQKEIAVKIQDGYGERSVIVDTAALNDIELEYDIVVGGLDNMPQNPIDRNQMLIALVDSLASKPMPLAMAELDLIDVPNREQIRQALMQFAQQQQQQKEQGGGPEVEKTKQRYHEGVSDILEDMAKKWGDKAPAFSLFIAAQLQQAAGGAPPNLAAIGELAIQLPAIEPEQPGRAIQ